ncbi:phytoene synthase [Aureimonas endophytica]|uniref:Phytoene synthase n=1 Tax=Aureimonas endophytica TaxID=2027858 RepID=A0A916ZCJ5_9HYPH|nr:phytoene/squalene synthase family protein [Aureimonas endophytica]GGD87183.1 phytoene synthase [Aureimonas endophytica]
MSDPFVECERIVQQDDPDRAVATAFAPADRRPFLNALYAFDLETARVRRIVSQPLPGEIRLQWWRDRLDALEADPLTRGGQGSPVAEALLQTIERCDLPLDAFRNLLEARIFDLYDDPMPSRTDLETYAGETASAVMILAAMVLDREAAPRAADVAGHAGVAVVAVAALRLLASRPLHAQIFFPSDVLEAVGCSRDALQTGDVDATARARTAMIAFARDHLAAARNGFGALPKSLRPAFLMLEPLDRSLRALEGGDASGETRANPLRRLFGYWRSMRR